MVSCCKRDAFTTPSNSLGCSADPELSKFIDAPTLERYRKVGGIRIEDDIVVTETGLENLTTQFLPSGMEELEAIIAADE